MQTFLPGTRVKVRLGPNEVIASKTIKTIETRLESARQYQGYSNFTVGSNGIERINCVGLTIQRNSNNSIINILYRPYLSFVFFFFISKSFFFSLVIMFILNNDAIQTKKICVRSITMCFGLKKKSYVFNLVFYSKRRHKVSSVCVRISRGESLSLLFFSFFFLYIIYFFCADFFLFLV